MLLLCKPHFLSNKNITKFTESRSSSIDSTNVNIHKSSWRKVSSSDRLNMIPELIEKPQNNSKLPWENVPKTNSFHTNYHFAKFAHARQHHKKTIEYHRSNFSSQRHIITCAHVEAIAKHVANKLRQLAYKYNCSPLPEPRLCFIYLASASPHSRLL